MFPLDKTIPTPAEPMWMQWESKEVLPMPNSEFWLPVK